MTLAGNNLATATSVLIAGAGAGSITAAAIIAAGGSVGVTIVIPAALLASTGSTSTIAVVTPGGTSNVLGGWWSPDVWGSARIARYTADDVLTSGAAITAWANQNGATNATQANAAYQAVYVASHPALNNKPAAYVTNDYYVCTGLVNASTSRSYCFITDNHDATTADQIMFDAQTGRLAVYEAYNATSKGFFDGGGKVSAAWTNTTGANSEVFAFNGATAKADLYRKGSASLAQLTYAATAVGGTVRMFANQGNVLNNIRDCHVREVTVIDRSATANDRSSWFAHSLADAGV